MSQPIEDYGFIGNTLTGALVSRDGAIDWLCLPRFDGDACFAALLGDASHGRWRIAPAGPVRSTSRRYLPDTAVLETTFETDEGRVTLVDFMPFSDEEHYVDVVRLVRADAGCVRMRMDLTMRFGYGLTVPWVRREANGLSAVVGQEVAPLTETARTDAVTRGELAEALMAFVDSLE